MITDLSLQGWTSVSHDARPVRGEGDPTLEPGVGGTGAPVRPFVSTGSTASWCGCSHGASKRTLSQSPGAETPPPIACLLAPLGSAKVETATDPLCGYVHLNLEIYF